MRTITLILTLLWLPYLLTGWSQFDDYFFWRHQLIMYTGLLALAYMSIAVLLSVRFDWVNEKLQGLDKSYAMHKKLGIGATVALIVHWFLTKSAHWLIDSGFISPPNRGPRPEITGINWHSLAEGVGDISFKIFLIFSIVSLVQAISYKKFKFIHKIGGLLMIAGIFHSMLLLDWNWSSLPMNIAITLLSMIGVWCSFLSLTGKIGKKNKASGKVTEVKRLSQRMTKGNVMRFVIQLDSVIDYKEGQFAYLNFHDGESPHPFSILNYNQENNTIEFGVKDLGDYTNHLLSSLSKGNKVTVEGGYGHFQISKMSQQVWIGAGIGIVPLISRLYWLQHQTKNDPHPLKKVYLFYCVNSKKEAYFEQEILRILEKLTHKLDSIELNVLDAERGELLDAKHILNRVENTSYDVSFCGPEPFANSIKKNLVAAGLQSDQFHSEIFNIR